ncbi:unnamed protein product [Cuscuta europaea]|uniref:ribonuclease Z n=2 Tax=Cuscuta europaea TaxID=41803 RepID=A0A9P1ECN8_CUSEU|nr:unnamed protein product [Cuscuta europaea]CAH9095464.1 unnamed protein product [Cuscuta europaea]
MHQITSLRLLSSTVNHHHLLCPLIKLKSPKISHNHFLFAIFSSYSSKLRYNRNNSKNNPNTLSSGSRHSSSMPEKMEGSSCGSEYVGFNKRRAEGNDNSDKPKKNLQRKVRKLNPVNTISYIQILGTGMDTQDTSPSVLLFFDKQRFIFNAGEGLQRFCTEHKVKLSKIDHIFLSRVCSETASGLPGLLLTLAGMGEENQGLSVNVWGPSDLKYLVEAMKSFIPNAAMVHTNSFGPALGDDFTTPNVHINDEVVKISSVLLRPRHSKGSLGINVLTDTVEDGTKCFSEPEFSLKPGDLSVVYICELPDIKGKFDPAKAADLGLRPGPKYRELQQGNSVKADKQDILIHPSDVMGPSVPGPIVLIVDCPTMYHLEELYSIESLAPYYSNKSPISEENCKLVNCVVHLSPSTVTTTSMYQQWMSRFGGAQHIMAGHELKNIEIPILKASARVATRLNYLSPQLFPAPGFWSLKQLNGLPPSSIFASEGSLPHADGIISAENLLKFHLRPYSQLGLDRSCVPNLTSPPEIISELISEIPEIENASQHITQLWHGGGNRDVNEEPCLEGIKRDDMEIVLLGTGSSQPSKYRNVSSIFINLFSKGGILLDCGEGTLGQLKRRYGIEGADEAVKSLRCIWISHIHADHHTGLARILALRRNLLKDVPHKPLIVIGPRQLKRFLDAYQRLEDLDMQFLDCRNTTESSLKAFESHNGISQVPNGLEENVQNGNATGELNQGGVDSSLFVKGSPMQSYWKRPGSPVDSSLTFPILRNLNEVLSEAGLEGLISFPVIHCPLAYGVVLRAAERTISVGKRIPGWKIVYSGDTRPCPDLIEASRGATVLIHEATFEDGMLEEAIARNHSTTKEAVETGDTAGAYRVILTHFSQRYPKIPVFDESHMHKTCIAFDLMSINAADLPVVPTVLPYLKLLFRDELVAEDDAAANLADAAAIA